MGAAADRNDVRAARRDARAAYYAKDWRACGRLFAQSQRPYEAARCFAQAGLADDAFATLAHAIDGGLHGEDPTDDSKLEPLHTDPRWATEMAHLSARRAEWSRDENAELTQLYAQDQADRSPAPGAEIDWTTVEPRDQARRKRVDEIIASRGARVADDYFHAAMVYQHGDTPAEIQRAHDLALKAVALDPDHGLARWLAAASEDRKLMYEHRAQKWGTQYKKLDGEWIVWPVDPAITDEQRDDWEVPPLAVSLQRAAQMNAPAK
ncbi:MAG: hypothetical protein K8W52_09220 [Deltaproteobacteria bacterium]|nr:hypothetical protein [Deltaproteobacteria bacterium]